jgi:aminopeptidase-like protein
MSSRNTHSLVEIARSESEQSGREMYAWAAELYPIFRSMTGAGVRETLERLQRLMPLELHEVPSGTQVFDWQVPQEWVFRDAYIREPGGAKVVDHRHSNLHVVANSVPMNATLPWSELSKHLFTLPEHPDWIPYRTAYFKDDWGFCLTHRQYLELEQRGADQPWEVCLDTALVDGSLTYGEAYLPGTTEDEVLVSCHVCHPSMANDNLSGIVVATRLARSLQALERRYSYRFLFAPATIGAITWLSRNQSRAARVKHGLILTVLGDAGPSTYKRSRRGDAEIDRAAAHVLQHSGQPHELLDFEPLGYDERQFCSPGFDLPIGVLMRTPNGRYPEYHSSADNLDFIEPRYLADSWTKCMRILHVLETDASYLNRNPNCEPQLGRRGLYHAYGDEERKEELQKAMLWVLNLSDGEHSLLDVAERSGLDFGLVRQAADRLLETRLLEAAMRRTSPTSTR